MIVNERMIRFSTPKREYVLLYTYCCIRIAVMLIRFRTEYNFISTHIHSNIIPTNLYKACIEYFMT